MRATLGLLLAALPVLVFGQDTPDNPPPGRSRRIIEVQSVSVSSGYYTSGTPAGFELPTQSLFLGPTALVSGSVTFGGSTSSEKGGFTWNYSPSYFSTVYSQDQRSNHGSFDHRAGVYWRRRLGNRWTAVASANGILASLEQLYFAPGLLTGVAALPTSFDDLAAATLAGKFTDAQLAALLTGSPLQASPEQAFPYGTRLMSAGANFGLSWAPSGRTTVALTLSGTRTQSVKGAGVTGLDIAAATPSLPQMTNATAALSWSYSMSPRTQFSVQATSSRTFSGIQQGYASSGNVSLGRTMSRRWFVQGRAGAGVLSYSRQQFAQPEAKQYLFGGTLGFKTSSHTFVGSYDRTLGDPYGLGSGTTGTASGAWNWVRPGSGWAASAAASYQQLNNPTFVNTGSWRLQGSVSRSLTRSIQLSWQYIYFQIPLGLTVGGQDQTEHGVLVSLSWKPPSF